MKISSILKTNFFVAFAFLFMLITNNANAQKLELKDKSISIENFGSQAIEKDSFIYKKEKSDSVLIESVLVNYGDAQKRTALDFQILELEGDSILYSNKMKKRLTKSELKNGITLYCSKNYLIKHGEKEWKLTFYQDNEKVLPPVDKKDVDDVQKGNQDEPKAAGWLNKTAGRLNKTAGRLNYILPFFVVLLLGLLLVLGAKWFKKKKGSVNPKEPRILGGRDEDTTKPEDKVEQPIDQLNADEKKEKEVEREKVEKNAEYENLVNTLRNLLQITAKDLDEPMLLNELKKRLENYKSISTELGVENISLQDLRDKQDNERKEQERKIQGVYAAIIEQIKKKDDLKKIFNNVNKETDLGPDQDKITKFFNVIDSKLKSKGFVVSNDEPKEFMLTTQNSYQVKKWLGTQFEEVGIDFDKNKRISDNLLEIANKINMAVESSKRGTDEEIILSAIKKDGISDTIKKELLVYLIALVNKGIENEENKLPTNLDWNGFFAKIDEKLEMPNEHEEAINKNTEDIKKHIKNALDMEVESFEKDDIQKAFWNVVSEYISNKVKGLEIAPDQNGVTVALKTLSDIYNKVEQLKKEYAIDSLDNIVASVKQKEIDQIIASNQSDIESIISNEVVKSAESLIKKLIKSTKDSRKEYALIVEDLKAKLNVRKIAFEEQESNALNLIYKYNTDVEKNENTLKTDIATKKEENESLTKQLADEQMKTSDLEGQKANLMNESSSMIEALHECALNIKDSRLNFMNACSESDENQCNDIEDRIYEGLGAVADKLIAFDVEKETIPVEVRKQIQNILVSELESENSQFNVVCRYYAYSCLSFMTDTTRDYGITFKRNNIFNLFSSVESALVRFGIRLDIPKLFVMGLNEGDYDNLTGKEYSDLDNLCPNSRNHVDNVDSGSKPTDMIVDIVKVGYTVDGQLGRKTSVLTY